MGTGSRGQGKAVHRAWNTLTPGWAHGTGGITSCRQTPRHHRDVKPTSAVPSCHEQLPRGKSRNAQLSWPLASIPWLLFPLLTAPSPVCRHRVPKPCSSSHPRAAHGSPHWADPRGTCSEQRVGSAPPKSARLVPHPSLPALQRAALGLVSLSPTSPGPPWAPTAARCCQGTAEGSWGPPVAGRQSSRMLGYPGNRADIAGDAGKLCPRCAGCHRRCQGNSRRHPAGKGGGGAGEGAWQRSPASPACMLAHALGPRGGGSAIASPLGHWGR